MASLQTGNRCSIAAFFLNSIPYGKISPAALRAAGLFICSVFIRSEICVGSHRCVEMLADIGIE